MTGYKLCSYLYRSWSIPVPSDIGIPTIIHSLTPATNNRSVNISKKDKQEIINVYTHHYSIHMNLSEKPIKGQPNN